MKAISFSRGKRVQPLYANESGLYGTADGPNKFGDVAHIPGSGPKGKLCRECDFIRHNKGASQWGKCGKCAEMRHVSLNALSLIPLTTEACKHFKERPKDGAKPWDRIDRTAEEIKEPEMF